MITTSSSWPRQGDCREKIGSLDGLTILRFAQAFESGGGIEQYLEDLNGALSERNAITTIQLYMTRNEQAMSEEIITIGRGRLVKVPLFLRDKHPEGPAPDTAEWQFKDWFRDSVLFNPLVYHLFTKDYLKRRRVPRRIGEPEGVRDKVRELLSRFKVDFVVLHSAGGASASEVLAEAQAARIPAALIHHYSNDRLSQLSLRQQVSLAQGVAGVCSVDVPRYLRDRFFLVSDGIDTEFFQRKKARPVGLSSREPVVLLPARIDRAKGQMDLLLAAALLRREGIKPKIAFAGRSDIPQFADELTRLTQTYGIADQILFLGQLNRSELKDWYAASALLAFPTYHHEGLGRVLLESQAMEVPAVVYKSGGTPDGLIPGKTGILLEKGDVRGLARAIKELLADNVKRREMGAAGRRFVVERFSLSALVERHEQFYRQLLYRQ